jgi:hypothetical protein
MKYKRNEIVYSRKVETLILLLTLKESPSSNNKTVWTSRIDGGREVLVL